MSLKRNKIHGISFHHRSSKKFRKATSKLQDFFNLDELYQQIKKETPTHFSNWDIKRFLGDHGRNEINSQISMCIDFISKWSAILKVCERCFPDRYFLNFEYITQTNDALIGNEIDIYLSIKKLIRLWRHNLNIVEMSAEAQYFLR